MEVASEAGATIGAEDGGAEAGGVTLVDQERETYETVWSVPDYANTSPGEQLVKPFMEMAGITMDQTYKYSVLDAGCGSGKGAVALRRCGFGVTMCDLTPDGLIPEASKIRFKQVCLWDSLKPRLPFSLGGTYDYVYCTDVLEHIPTPFVMLVVHRLMDVARRGVFLSIALQEDNFGVWAGKPLHRTIQNFVAWRDQLSEMGRVVESRDLLMNGLYLLESK